MLCGLIPLFLFLEVPRFVYEHLRIILCLISRSSPNPTRRAEIRTLITLTRINHHQIHQESKGLVSPNCVSARSERVNKQTNKLSADQQSEACRCAASVQAVTCVHQNLLSALQELLSIQILHMYT